MLFGFVFWYSELKGYGFIRKDGAALTDRDFFVHYTGVAEKRESGRRFLIKGERVSFEPSIRMGKPCAINVKLIGSLTPEVVRQDGSSDDGNSN